MITDEHLDTEEVTNSSKDTIPSGTFANSRDTGFKFLFVYGTELAYLLDGKKLTKFLTSRMVFIKDLEPVIKVLTSRSWRKREGDPACAYF